MNSGTGAIVAEGAKIGTDVEIGPWTYIGPEVEIESGTKIGPRCTIDGCIKIGPNNRFHENVSIHGWTTIGEGNEIYPFAVIGTEPQDLKFKGDRSYVKIGDNNKIREFATIHRSTGPDEITEVGNNNLIMAYVHIAHNCIVGNHCILANVVTLAGHVIVDDYAILGGLTAVHQFVRIGKHSITGGESKVTKDVPPYLKCDGHPMKPYGLNSVGLRRRGFTNDEILEFKRAYRIIFRSNLPTRQALERVETELNGLPMIKDLVDFTRSSERGICK